MPYSNGTAGNRVNEGTYSYTDLPAGPKQKYGGSGGIDDATQLAECEVAVWMPNHDGFFQGIREFTQTASQDDAQFRLPRADDFLDESGGFADVFDSFIHKLAQISTFNQQY